MKRFPWLSMRKKTEAELPYEPPLWFGDQSNGEYFRRATRRDRATRRLVLEKSAENARRVGMDRRHFLASSMGMATSLWVANAVSGCASDDSPASTRGGGRDSGAGGAAPDQGARFCVPDEAMFDEEVACSVLSGDEFIFDIQTHWFKREDLSRFPLYLQLFESVIARSTEDQYLEQIFCDSDTDVACLSAWPGVACTGSTTTNCGLPLSNESNVASRDKINALAGHTQRILNHVQIMVQDPQGVDYQLRIMEQMCAQGVAAWKVYPGFKPAFTLDDPNGRAVIEKGLELGVPVFCVHKGLPLGSFFDVMGGNHPREVGLVARDYQDARFIVYHSGICTGSADCNSAAPEGPYDPNDPEPMGVDALLRSLQDHGIEPNSNVYAEVGSALNEIFKSPVAAAHFFGKLMKHVGTDNVLWGTDCIIYGSPQPFIEQFRALEIPESMQEQYGYPALDAVNKAKILGLNAARLHRVDVARRRCEIETCALTARKRELDAELGARRWAFREPTGPRTWGEFLAHAEDCVRIGRPG